MIAMITLGVIGILVLVGLGRNTLKDFHINAIFFVLMIAAVIGLNFIPTLSIGAFSFRIGSLLLYLFAFVMFWFFGRFTSQITAFGIALILGGLAFAATRLALLGGGGFFATTNWVYALIIGTLSFLLTQNGKFSFVVSVIAMMLFNGLVQIGTGAYNLHFGFDWTVIALLTSVAMFEVFSRVMRKPSKLAYYFETSRMEEHD
ncbi:MAG: hypothetical protein PHI19_03190 [Clostridia bacterium]|nr:hypothetical protein [Clostridia bacterium]